MLALDEGILLRVCFLIHQTLLSQRHTNSKRHVISVVELVLLLTKHRDSLECTANETIDRKLHTAKLVNAINILGRGELISLPPDRVCVVKT
jgi:hypothetical protein